MAYCFQQHAIRQHEYQHAQREQWLEFLVMWRAWIVALALLLGPSADAAFWSGLTHAPSSCANGCTLPVGAGGFVIGQFQANDGTWIIRNDTYGAYIWNANTTAPNGVAGTWQQVVNSNSMPGVNGNEQGSQIWPGGIYAFQLEAKNSQIMFMVANTYIANQNPVYQTVYKSTNQGQTWAATGFTALNFQAYFGGDSGGSLTSIKTWGPKLSIDPTDATAQTVYVGTGANGLYCSLNGGTSFSQVSTASVPAATADGSGNYPGINVNISGYNHQDIFAYSYGNGVYLTTNASASNCATGSTWTLINSGSGPAIVTRADIDPNTGTYYAVDAVGNAWSYVIGTGWTEIYTASGGDDALSLAVDPCNQVGSSCAGTGNHIILDEYNGGTPSGNLNESTNGGSSWGGWTSACDPCTATNDVTWLNAFADNANGILFDRVTPKKLLTVSNRGVWTWTYSGSLSSASTAAWNSQSRGIEQLVGTRVLAATSNAPIVASWDTATFTTGFNSYPSTSYPTPLTLIAGFGLDNCSSSTGTVVANIDGSPYGSGGQDSAYTTNNGSSWTALPNVGSYIYPSGSGSGGGFVACSTPNNIIIGNTGQAPYYTTNGGTGWTQVSISGANWSHFQGFNDFGGQPVCADRGNANTFYLYIDTDGFYVSTDSGAAWTSLSSLSANNPSSAQIKCTPGESGDWWFSGGQGQGGGQSMPCGQVLLHYYNGGPPTTITNVECPYTVGFGANPGGGYPSVFMIGWVDVSGTWTYGVWRSDNASTGATPTWNLVQSFGCNSLDNPHDITGDPGVPKRAYIAFAGSGWCRINYLLNRDLDPASNDNTPAYLDKVG
jgi:hypothetical protein